MKNKIATDLEQSKKLAEILPIESADMVLPFRHLKNDEYILGYAVSRNYVEVYNEMMTLPAMEKEDVYKLIQPAWSLAALLNVLPKIHGLKPILDLEECSIQYSGIDLYITANNPTDACCEMILKLKEENLL